MIRISLLAALVVARIAGAQPPRTALAGQVELARLVDLAAQRLAVPVEYDEGLLKGSVTVRLPAAIDDAELWDLTNRLLAQRGFTTVRPPGAGGLSVVRLADAAALAGVTLPDSRADAGPAPGYLSVLIPVHHVPAKAAADALSRVLSKPGGAAVPLGDSLPAGVSVTASGAGGWLLVSDLAPRIGQARHLLELVDTPAAGAVVEEIALSHLSPEAMKGLLDTVNAGAGGAALPGELATSPDGASLLVAAPRGAVEPWRALAARFDRPEPVRTLAYTPRGVAPAAAAVLVERAARPLAPGDDRWLLSVEESTGSMVVTATAAQHEAIAQLLLQVESARGQEQHAVRWFPIRHRDARDLESLLTRLVNQESGAAPDDRTLNPGLDLDPRGISRVGESPDATPLAVHPFGRAEGPAQGGAATEPPPPPAFTVTSDEGTNTLIALGEPRLLDQAAELIARLDVPQPQVMLEVVMVSLSDSQARDLGVELEYLSISGDTLTRLSSLFGLGTRSGASEAPGPGSGLTGVVLNPGDFSILIRALETIQEGRSLSRPRVLVGNNEQATLNSVQEQPFATTSASNSSTITSFGGTLQAGTQVSVTPRISSGDRLTLEYSVSLSSFTGTATPTLPPPRQQNTVQSLATIPDGHTVVVGGIELETTSRSQSRVPLLGAIPIVGEAFKSRSRSSGRARFYIFIRADILRARGLEDLRHLSAKARGDVGVPDGWPAVHPRVMR